MLGMDKKINEQIKAFAAKIGSLVLSQDKKTDKTELALAPGFLQKELKRLHAYLQKSDKFDEELPAVTVEFDKELLKVVDPKTGKYRREKINRAAFTAIEEQLGKVKAQLPALKAELSTFNNVSINEGKVQQQYSELLATHQALATQMSSACPENKSLFQKVEQNFQNLRTYSNGLIAQQTALHEASESIVSIERHLGLLIPPARVDASRERTVSRSPSSSRNAALDSPPSTPSNNPYASYRPVPASVMDEEEKPLKEKCTIM